MLYTEKLIHRVYSLDILSTTINWSRRINDALDKFLDFIQLTAEDAGDDVAAKLAQQCRVRFINPHRKKCVDERGNQRTRRIKIDKSRIEMLPPAELMNSVATQATLDMAVLHAAYHGPGITDCKSTTILRRALNTMAYGVAAYRTFPGRPGEWSRMQQTKVIECLADAAKWYIIVTDHKTFATSGALGRYMPPDVKYVFKLLIDMNDPSMNLLFQPTRFGTVQMAKLAVDFQKMYTPSHQCPEPTLMRKFCESAIADKSNADKASRMADKVEAALDAEGSQRAAAMAAKMSGHSTETQKRYYDLNSDDPVRHALTSKAYIEEFIGPLVQQPSQDAIASTARTADVILSEFKERTSRGCDADADECGNYDDVANDDDTVVRDTDEVHTADVACSTGVKRGRPGVRWEVNKTHTPPHGIGTCHVDITSQTSVDTQSTGTASRQRTLIETHSAPLIKRTSSAPAAAPYVDTTQQRRLADVASITPNKSTAPAAKPYVDAKVQLTLVRMFNQAAQPTVDRKRRKPFTEDQIQFIVAQHNDISKMKLCIATKSGPVWHAIVEAGKQAGMLHGDTNLDSLRNVVRADRKRRIERK